MSRLTFVVPSIGRQSIIDTIESLQAQTVQQWKAIIVFDCVDPSADVLELIKSDHRITYHILTEKLGKYNNCAGEVRNYGIKFVETEWIAFVDDDDCLRPDYIERFHESLEQLPELDCIIFRMIDSRRVCRGQKNNRFGQKNKRLFFCPRRFGQKTNRFGQKNNRCRKLGIMKF